MSERPVATVGLPVFNGERYLEASLRSVMQQTLDDIEIVVADNASTDRSVEIVRDLAGGDPRIRLIQQPENLGAAANYNAVAEAARAPYFRWTAADDLMAPTLLERFIALREANPSATLAYPRTQLIDADGRPTEVYDDRLDLRHASAWRRLCGFVRRINLCSAVFGVYRTPALQRTGMIRPFRGSDAVLLYEAALHGPVCEHPEPLFMRRVHAEASQEKNSTEEALQAWWDPKRRRDLTFLSPRQRLLFEYLRLTWQGPLAPIEREWTMLAVLAVWSYRRGRINAGLWRRRLGLSRGSVGPVKRFPTQS